MLWIEQIRFCARECEKQKSGEMSVANMCDAYECAVRYTDIRRTFPHLTNDFVLELGRRVEPVKNANGFRTTPVYFRVDMTEKAIDPHLVPQALNSLISHGQNLTAEEGYQEFEKIHPFIDGNGRVGAILYNIFLGNLTEPTHPPDLFNIK